MLRLRLPRLPLSPYSRQRLHPRLWALFAAVVTACCVFTDWQTRVFMAR